MTYPPIILASSSPRRFAVLTQIGVPFSVQVSNFNEREPATYMTAKAVEKLVRENAFGKASVVEKKVSNGLIIGVDTLIYGNGYPMGKPKDTADAIRMLSNLNNTKHTVFSGICLLLKNGGSIKKKIACDISTVWFRKLTKEEITRYAETGEPLDKAGAYGIQEKGAMLVRKVEGDYFSVVGFPLVLFMELTKQLHIKVL